MRLLPRALSVFLLATLVACSGTNGTGGDGGANDGAPSIPDGARVLADGAVVLADGALWNPGGGDASLSPPDGSTVLPDGAIVLADGALWNPGGMDASVLSPPDGSTVLPDGAVVLADGALWNPGGGDASLSPPDGSTVLPDGAVVLADGALWNPGGGDASLSPPDGSTVLPDGAVVLPDGALWNPGGMDGGVSPPDGSTVLPDGAVVLPDGALWSPDAGPAVCPALADGGAACATTESCDNGLDDNCNGLVDEGCACRPGDRERCYDGCRAQAGVGVCTWGTMTCAGVGELGTYDGHCTGAGHPMTVVCGGFRDWLCDGMIDEGCGCRTGEMRPCYSGPPATRNVGACQDGVQRCQSQDGGTGWGPCTGEVLPTSAQCDGIDHACTGDPFGGCACVPGSTRSCYSGPPGTSGVGLCRAGMQSCVVTGGTAAWGTCVGEVVPAANQCDGIDRACNGMPNAGCACMPGAMRSCYSGPMGTDGVGQCHAGRQTCVTGPGGTTVWSPCAGEVLPSAGICDGIDHLCNGMPNAGCACTPGTSRSCYSGPAGTAGVGLCHAGSQMCVSGPGGVGSSWGACTGEVLPAADQCDGVDRSCTGRPNASCVCTPNATRSCYDGPAGTAGVGQCRTGTQTCNATGTGWSPCAGEVLPSAGICDGIDHLCNGMPNAGCACTPGASRSCYSGPAGTAGVGLCHAGSQSCVSGPGGVGSSWGACTGEVVPSTNTCDGVDRACTGNPYAGCACVPGSTRACYSGPAGTAGVGLCRAGTQSCTDSGSGPAWGACTGQVLPSPALCDGLDHLCNGMPNAGCACTPGTSRACYSGPAGTAGVGLCRAGTQMCVSGPGGVGSSWGACSGEVLPSAVVCDGLDHACNGNYSVDCPCMPGATRSCYSGPAGTAGVGTCVAGTQTCVARAGGSAWGSCLGEVDPAAPQCDGLDHACTGALPNCNPTVTCPAPQSTYVGTPVTLTGSATPVAPATITGIAWSVLSAPSGASYTFNTATSNPTTFTANNPGVYTVRYTATDSLGRSASCSVLVTATSRSYLGTEFWAVTTANSQLDPVFHFAVAIGNPNGVAVTVNVTGGALGATDTFTVPANSAVTHTLPWVTAISFNNGTYAPASSVLQRNGAYHITTSAPVAAYEFNPLEFQVGATFSYTNDASLLLPTVALTGNYLGMAHQSWYTLGGFLAVVGTQSTPTTVQVTLRAPIRAGTGVAAAASGSTQTYTLNQGDVLQLVSSANPPACSPSINYCNYGAEDLTGSVITASAPVAVFGGHDCTNISAGGTGNCPACDHLEQQLFPVETWGRDVVVSALRDRWATEPYNVRIMTRSAGNTLTFLPASACPATICTTPGTVTLANAGDRIEFGTTVDFEVQGTQPLLVGQYMVGQNVTGVGTCTTAPPYTFGDPAFVLEVPAPQYRQNYNFVVPSSYTTSYIQVVGVTGSTILLDGVALSAAPTAIPGTTWSIWRQTVTPGAHVINTMSANGFGLKVMGVASYTSYMYPGGLDLRALP